MWNEAWGEKSGRITNEHIIPYSILNVLKLAVERTQTTPDLDTLENGKERWAAAKKEAAKRREHGAQY